jgi:hypothetical protein
MPSKFQLANFTLNNYTQAEVDQLVEWLSSNNVTETVVCSERGDTGTPHLQGCIRATSAKALATWKNVPGLSRAHFERAKRSKASFEYCLKSLRETPIRVIQNVSRGRISVYSFGKPQDVAAQHPQLWERVYVRGAAHVQAVQGALRLVHIIILTYSVKRESKRGTYSVNIFTERPQYETSAFVGSHVPWEDLSSGCAICERTQTDLEMVGPFDG